jgi:lipoprotein-anchoring transpeptidase ErfK/SrfK
MQPPKTLAALAVTVAFAFAAAATAAPASADTVLSNETTNTAWTIANVMGPIRAEPSPHARRVSQLRATLSDGFGLQSYVLLRSRRTKSGLWVMLRVPGRPNGRTGWVPRGDLNDYQHVHTELVVNRAAHEVTVYRRGRAVFHAPVGVGKPSTPTPTGHFWITEAFPSHDPFYGPYLLGTSDYSVLSEWPGGGIVGMHGTNEPNLVPGDPSHGCIRLHNSDILRVKSLVSIGTPLLIK